MPQRYTKERHLGGMGLGRVGGAGKPKVAGSIPGSSYCVEVSLSKIQDSRITVAIQEVVK